MNTTGSNNFEKVPSNLHLSDETTPLHPQTNQNEYQERISIEALKIEEIQEQQNSDKPTPNYKNTISFESGHTSTATNPLYTQQHTNKVNTTISSNPHPTPLSLNMFALDEVKHKTSTTIINNNQKKLPKTPGPFDNYYREKSTNINMFQPSSITKSDYTPNQSKIETSKKNKQTSTISYSFTDDISANNILNRSFHSKNKMINDSPINEEEDFFSKIKNKGNDPNSPLSPKTQLLIYNLRANSKNSKIIYSEKKRNIGYSLKGECTHKEEIFFDEEMFFDDRFNLDDEDGDEMRINFDLDNSIFYEEEHNVYNLEDNCNAISYKDRKNSNINDCFPKKVDITNSSYDKIENIPTILGRILKQEAMSKSNKANNDNDISLPSQSK